MTPARRLVLASASPARLRLLRDAGFDPAVAVSGVDETQVVDPDPWSLVERLAVSKAEVVAGGCRPGDVVVGCDSMLLIDGTLEGKPASPAVATDRWQRMRGRSGSLLTGHCVIEVSGGESVSAVADTVVHFGVPTDAEVAAYVGSGEPLHVAGGFTLDGRSAPFIDRIDGDPGTVIGLSLPTFRTLLRRLGIEIMELWR